MLYIYRLGLENVVSLATSLEYNVRGILCPLTCTLCPLASDVADTTCILQHKPVNVVRALYYIIVYIMLYVLQMLRTIYLCNICILHDSILCYLYISAFLAIHMEYLINYSQFVH